MSRFEENDGVQIGRTEENTHGRAGRLAMVLVAVSLMGVLVWRVNHLPSDQPHPIREPGFLVDVNQASADTLQLLPGLGPSIAENVVTRRETAGPFRGVEELEAVRMIGPVLRTRITPWITLGDVETNATKVAVPFNSPPSRTDGGADEGLR